MYEQYLAGADLMLIPKFTFSGNMHLTPSKCWNPSSIKLQPNTEIRFIFFFDMIRLWHISLQPTKPLPSQTWLFGSMRSWTGLVFWPTSRVFLGSGVINFLFTFHIFWVSSILMQYMLSFYTVSVFIPFEHILHDVLSVLSSYQILETF